MKKVLMYFLLIVLLFLLFLPPTLRYFLPKEVDLDEVEEGKNVITMIQCNRGGKEDLNFKYENKVIKELFYRVPGNKTYSGDTEITNEENEIVKSVYKYGYSRYNEDEEVTTFNIYFSSLELREPSLENYSLPVTKEKAFVEEMGFSCKIVDIESSS